MRFGVLVATDDDERARRTDRLAVRTHNAADFKIIADLVDVRAPVPGDG